MDDVRNEAPSGKSLSPLVHSWNPETRRIACGAPGQIGSSKHDRNVTCAECLAVLGRPPRTAFDAVSR